MGIYTFFCEKNLVIEKITAKNLAVAWQIMTLCHPDDCGAFVLVGTLETNRPRFELAIYDEEYLKRSWEFVKFPSADNMEGYARMPGEVAIITDRATGQVMFYHSDTQIYWAENARG